MTKSTDTQELAKYLDDFDGCGRSDCPGYKSDTLNHISAKYISKDKLLEVIPNNTTTRSKE